MKIGILGGTFNPIHLGHVHLALEVKTKINLDEILFIPSGIPPHKLDEELASPSDRLEMVKLAISDYPFFRVSDIEIKRGKKSYAIDTIRELKKNHPQDEFFFIIGLDAFIEIPSWKEYLSVLKSVHFIVVSRPGFKFAHLTRIHHFKEYPEKFLNQLDNGLVKKLELTLNGFPKMILLQIKPSSISASEIRKKIKKGQIGNKFLPETVKSFIIKKKVF